MATSRARKLVAVPSPRPPASGEASPLDAAKFAKSIPTEYVGCRAYGHQWDLARAEKRKSTVEVWIWCRRCKCNRRETVSRSGEVLTRKREYPEGYLVRGIGRINDRGVFRVESVSRLLAQ